MARQNKTRIRVRRPAIVFSLASAIYWMGGAAVACLVDPLAGTYHVPYWLAALANMVLGAVYAAATLFFCHWLARRVARQLQTGSR